MNASNKDVQNYNSPYAKSTTESEDYFSLEIGGSDKQEQQRYQQDTRSPQCYYQRGFNRRGGGMGRFTSTPAKSQTNTNESTNNSNSGAYFYQNNQPNRYKTYNNRYNNTPAGKFRQNFHQQRSQQFNEHQQPRTYYGQQQQQQKMHESNVAEGGGEEMFYTDTTGYQPRKQQHFNNRYKNVDISAYFHPSMLEDPWKELIERHNALNSSKIRMPEEEQTDEDESTDDDNDDNDNKGGNDNESDKDDPNVEATANNDDDDMLMNVNMAQTQLDEEKPTT